MREGGFHNTNLIEPKPWLIHMKNKCITGWTQVTSTPYIYCCKSSSSKLCVYKLTFSSVGKHFLVGPRPWVQKCPLAQGIFCSSILHWGGLRSSVTHSCERFPLFSTSALAQSCFQVFAINWLVAPVLCGFQQPSYSGIIKPTGWRVPSVSYSASFPVS